MGCACAPEREQEDSQAKARAKAPSPSPAAPAAKATKHQEPPQAQLAVGSVTHLAGSLEDRYQIVAQKKAWNGNTVRSAEFVATRKPCIIISFSKRSNTTKELRRKLEAFEKMTTFDHPHIRKIYEIIQGAEVFHLVVEHTDSEFVEYMQEKGKMSEDIVGKVAVQLLSVMCYVHNLGQVHGGLGPDCVGFQTIPETDVFIKVGAFFSEEWTRNEQMSIFEAPEMRSEQGGPPADIWSCGVLLFYALVGRFPYKSIDEVGRTKLSFGPNISKDAITLLRQMMKPNPEDRPDASSCLTSPWIRRFTGKFSKSPELRQHMRNLCAPIDVNSLRKAVLYFIVDRAVPQGEIAQVAKTFVALDINGDGILSKEELLTGLRVFMTETAAQAKVDDILASASSEAVDYSAFVVAALGPKALLSNANLKAAFSSIDDDDSGRISLRELKSVFRVESGEQDEAAWKSLLAKVDVSGDGEIDEAEFRSLMLKAAE
jgi:calcium-dependent protein kinase